LWLPAKPAGGPKHCGDNGEDLRRFGQHLELRRRSANEQRYC